MWLWVVQKDVKSPTNRFHPINGFTLDDGNLAQEVVNKCRSGEAMEYTIFSFQRIAMTT